MFQQSLAEDEVKGLIRKTQGRRSAIRPHDRELPILGEHVGIDGGPTAHFQHSEPTPIATMEATSEQSIEGLSLVLMLANVLGVGCLGVPFFPAGSPQVLTHEGPAR